MLVLLLELVLGRARVASFAAGQRRGGESSLGTASARNTSGSDARSGAGRPHTGSAASPGWARTPTRSPPGSDPSWRRPRGASRASRSRRREVRAGASFAPRADAVAALAAHPPSEVHVAVARDGEEQAAAPPASSRRTSRGCVARDIGRVPGRVCETPLAASSPPPTHRPHRQRPFAARLRTTSRIADLFSRPILPENSRSSATGMSVSSRIAPGSASTRLFQYRFTSWCAALFARALSRRRRRRRRSLIAPIRAAVTVTVTVTVTVRRGAFGRVGTL